MQPEKAKRFQGLGFSKQKQKQKDFRDIIGRSNKQLYETRDTMP